MQGWVLNNKICLCKQLIKMAMLLGGGSKIIDKKLDGVTGLETVKIATLDDTVGIDRTVSLIQLDVEGYEREALTGALKTIQRCLPIIILEILPNSTLLGSIWFSGNILSLGYCKTNSINGNSVFMCKSQDYVEAVNSKFALYRNDIN